MKRMNFVAIPPCLPLRGSTMKDENNVLRDPMKSGRGNLPVRDCFAPLAKQLIFVATGLALFVFLFMACAPREIPSPKGPAAAPEKPAPPVKTGWEAEWQKTLEAARKEVRVIVYASSPAPALNQSINLFKGKYGLNLEVLTGRGSEIRARIIQEQARGLFIGDIAIAGLNTIFGALKKAKVIDPLEPTLMLPEVIDPKAWYKNELPWADEEKLVIGGYAYPTRMIGINTKMVEPGEIKSYFDLLDTRWRGKIIINDPTVTGTAFNGFSTLLLNKVVNEDFFKELAGQQTALLRDQRLQIDWLARGRYPVALWPRSVHVAEYQEAGAPITEISVKEGSYTSSNGGNLVLLKNAPHPNAARIFINWFLSKEGQTIMQKVLKQQSSRADISTEGLAPTSVRTSGEKYLVSANESEKWVLEEQDDYLKLARELFAPLLR